jgi:hypothetical protein
MERSIDDVAGFINNIIGPLFQLSNNNANSLSLLVRRDGSLYENNAAKEDHKQDIIAFSVKLWIKNEENPINYDVHLEYEDWIVPTVKVFYCNFIASCAGQSFKK